MHSKTGKPIQCGDSVVVKDSYGNTSAGIVVKTNANADSCNVSILPHQVVSQAWTVNASDCVHVVEAVDAARALQNPAPPAPKD